MDTFFISHGSPMLSIDDSLPARPFLQSWRSEVMRVAPRAILVVSGHWETAAPAVNVVDGPLDTIYDFYGFPEAMYKAGLFLVLMPMTMFSCIFIRRNFDRRDCSSSTQLQVRPSWQGG